MRVQVYHVFFKNDPVGNLVPSDPELYSLAAGYAEQNLKDPIDFRNYLKTWVACEVNDEGKPARALGILCLQMRADFPICRFTDNAAVVKLVQRANDFLHDSYGARGSEALVHIKKDEPAEARCPDYLEWMKLFNLKPADRWLITVR